MQDQRFDDSPSSCDSNSEPILGQKEPLQQGLDYVDELVQEMAILDTSVSWLGASWTLLQIDSMRVPIEVLLLLLIPLQFYVLESVNENFNSIKKLSIFVDFLLRNQ